MPPHANPHHERRWLILAVIGIAQLMIILDVTIVNIALPSAQRDLGFSNDSRQWIVTAYSLAFGSLLLLGGRVADLFGRKTAFVAGLIGFAGASAIGGFSESFGMLVAARALQGTFGALLAPSALSLLATTFTEPSERNKAFGVYGAIAGSGSAVGLLLGGMLTEWLSWRWCLFVNLFFAAIAVFGAVSLLHNARAERRPRLDIPGTLAASAGLFCLVYGFSHANTTTWGNTLTLVALAAGVVLLAVFVAIQRRVANPLLPLRILLDRNRGGSYLAVGISGIAMFGVFLFLTYYLQQNLAFTPIQTGLAFLPMTASIMITATSSTTQLLPRVGPRFLVGAGMLLACAGMVILTGLGVSSSYAGHVLPALIVAGIGFGLIFAPSFSGATLGVAPEDSGVASATVNTMQQIGGSIGTAALSTFAANAAASFATSHPKGPGLAAQAAVHGYTTAFWWSAAIFLLGALVCGSLLRASVPRQSAVGEPVLAH